MSFQLKTSVSMTAAAATLILVLLCSGATTGNFSKPPQPTSAAGKRALDGNLKYVYWRNATKRAVGSIVPKPSEINYLQGIDYLEIDVAQFNVDFDAGLGGNCLTLKLAKERYLKGLIFDDLRPEPKDDPYDKQRRLLGSLNRLTLAGPSDGSPFECELLPHQDMDEAYELHVTGGGGGNTTSPSSDGQAVVRARTSWGILRGLESFSQLVFNIAGRRHYKENGDGNPRYAIQPVAIRDWPRFKHRGYMLDTARHYISLERIFELLDAMSYNKLNVFHWHIVDDQSFPYESITYPQVSKRTSYRPHMVYSQQDVRMVIVYAAMRGIRVMPELDTPGHTYALRHVPDLLSECYDLKTKKLNGDFGPIDPTRESSYKSVDRLLAEFSLVFPDSHFHAGGDEVDFDCWKSNPIILKWMEAHNITGKFEELSNYYLRRLYDMLVNGHNKTVLVWQEVFDMGASLPLNNTIVHVWKYINDKPAYMAELAGVLNAGYQAILSSCWYLNYIDYGQDWIKYYQCEPTASPVAPEKEHLVLGGEICMWTEFVDDNNVVARTWPRASAAAERLWSPKSSNNIDEFLHRLEQHRCRLISRGIPAEPVNGPGYC